MVDFKYKSMPLKSVYTLLEENGFVTDATVLREAMPGKNSTLRRAKRGMALEVLRSKGLLDKFISDCWPNGASEDGKRRMARYEKHYQQWTDSSDQAETSGGTTNEDETDSDADSFAYETDLRDYLAKNPASIEPGMTLWDCGEGLNAVEYYADDHRRIDILAKDAAGIPVVIELKVNRGHEKVIGQALYYRECVKDKFSAAKVRIIIVARELSPELRLAARGIPDVDLYEYRLSMTLKKCSANIA